jgi:hypothetical protein
MNFEPDPLELILLILEMVEEYLYKDIKDDWVIIN